MAKSAEQQERGNMSVADIAATLIKPVPAAEEDIAEEDQLDPTGGESEEDTDVDTSEEEDGGDEWSDEDQNETGDEQEDEQPDDDADDDETEYLDIDDSDLITVLVDGEEQEVSIGDLKKAHSLAGATEGRLQEATETRKAAHAERTQMLEKLAEEERAITEALTGLDDSVFKPVIPKPDESVRRSNPEQYLRHKEAYDADQQRIAEAKRTVEGRLEQIKRQRSERLNEYAQQAGQILLQEIPELRDEKKSQKMVADLASTAKFYGYTDQEIQSALDPRMFMLVRDAMRYREMTSKGKEQRDPTNLEGQKAKKVRRLRSGNTQAKNRVRAKDKQRQAVKAKAKQTGKVQDVAAMLLTSKG